MRCKHCRRLIYFTGVLYRLVNTNSFVCYSSPDRMHKHI
jgi:hypothetical protein